MNLESKFVRRLTIHPGRDLFPRWTPDGKSIVFTSDRYGNNDVFIIGADGSNPRRLNFESSSEQVTSFSPDGQFIYGTTNLWGRSDVFRLSIQGGPLVRLTDHPLELEYQPFALRDGKRVLFVSGSSGGSWRNPNQNGSNTAEVWVGDAGAPIRNMKKLTNNEWMDFSPVEGKDGWIYFISNRTGWPNLWKMRDDGSKQTQVTFLKDGVMRFATHGGGKIAFEYDSEVHLYDTASSRLEKVDVDLPDDARANPETTLTLATGAYDHAISPDGKRIVLAIREELWLIPEKGGATRRLTNNPAWDHSPLWLDDKTVAFATGRTGKREIWTTDTSGNAKPFLADATKDVGGLQLSPDGKSVAFIRGENELCVMPSTKGAIKTVATGGFGGAITDQPFVQPFFSWSPDSKYLVVALSTDRGGTNIVLVQVETGTQTIIAKAARDSSTPQFLPNGKAVFFTANEFENEELFIVDLVREAVTFAEDDLDKLDEPKKEEPKKAPVTVEIQLEGLEDRMRRLVPGSAFGPIATPDSRAILVSLNGQWTSVNAQTGAATPVAAIAGPIGKPKFDKAGTKMYYITDRYQSYALGAPAPSPIPYSATLTLNLRTEEKALFEEVWWAMDRGYYDPKMHGKNWVAIREKYAKILPHTTDRDDFYALLNEMIEELNSSHLGATAPSAGTPGEQTGNLGVEWDWAKLAGGAYVVARVQPGTPASHPQMKLLPGDQIVSVNGVSPTATEPLAKLLSGQVGKKVRLKVLRDGKEIEVIIKPASPGTRTGDNYLEWVKANRAIVEKLSGGKLAYHHYPGMNAPSQANFLREIRSMTQGKKGIIIDVRFNGGGFTAHQALGVLVKQPWLVRTRRDMPGLKISENIYRGDSLELPSALMTNQYSFSNAEIFSEGFRRLKIGPVIGEATGGGVIGTGAYFLWDGGNIRMPAYGAYAIDGQNLENNGRKTDVNVLWDPNAYLEGRDVQLEAAVKELMKKIK